MTDLPIDVNDFTEYDTIEEALSAVALELQEPLGWNIWQRVVAGLRPHYPTANGDNKYLSQLRKNVMDDLKN